LTLVISDSRLYDLYLDWGVIVYIHCVSPQKFLLTFIASIRLFCQRSLVRALEWRFRKQTKVLLENRYSERLKKY